MAAGAGVLVVLVLGLALVGPFVLYLLVERADERQAEDEDDEDACTGGHQPRKTSTRSLPRERSAR